ncbi:MAG: hypothetical protein FJ280_17650 [Planctomycetes bacterium]|nr:hypothetical protein [Planctomycetota bacterium]
MDMTLTILFGILGLSGVTLFGLYSRARDILTSDIRNRLEDCRRLKSWNDRSEMKLISWVHGDERDLHKKSVRELHRIRNNMVTYWQIHLEMQESERYGEIQTQEQAFSDFVIQEVLGMSRRCRR